MSILRTKSQPVKTFDPERVDEEAKKTRRTFLDNMDAIAYGVEAWFEENTGYSSRVHETTVDIARALGIPEAEIERWASSRLTRGTEKLNGVKSLLERLQKSFIQPCDNGNISGK